MPKQKPAWLTFRSAQSSPMNQSLTNTFRFNDLILNKQKKSSLASSQKNKLKFMHISSVHEVIAYIRQKKWQIENLLVSQLSKAEKCELNQAQMTTSLSKMRKVARLMEIVCNIILGKNEQPKIHNISSLRSDSHSNNPEYNYNQKARNSLTPSNRIKSFTINEPKRKKENLTIDILQNQSDNEVDDKIKKFEVANEDQLHNITKYWSKNDVVKEENYNANRMEIKNQFDVWGIMDRNGDKVHEETQTIEKSDILEQKWEKNRLESTNMYSIKVKPCWKFVKKYKEMLKITMNSLSVCNKLLARKQKNQAHRKLEQSIQQICQSFNLEYKRSQLRYDGDFYLQFKQKVSSCYENVQSRFKQIYT